MKNNTHETRQASIQIHEHGVMTIAPVVRVNPPKGGKRGVIKGWSQGSRRRLRKFMLTHSPNVDSWEMNVTLTVPGPSLAVDDLKALWKWFSREAQKRGWSAVWRLEIQKRGQAHWHLWMIAPKRSAAGSRVAAPSMLPEKSALEIDRSLVWMGVRNLWLEALNTLGPVEHKTHVSGAPVHGLWEGRGHLPGADYYSVNISFEESGDGHWRWRRYMQDHTSKAKQAQIADGFGRHWGVIGRRGFVSSVPDRVYRLDEADYFRVLRWMQRLVTGSIPAPGAPFGRKIGKRSMRGVKGSSVWFSRPDVVSRMIDLATSDPSMGGKL